MDLKAAVFTGDQLNQIKPEQTRYKKNEQIGKKIDRFAEKNRA